MGRAFTGTQGLFDFVRRRKWVRTAVKIQKQIVIKIPESSKGNQEVKGVQKPDEETLSSYGFDPQLLNMEN